MAAAFDANTRQLIRLWADKAPECGSTDKPRAFKDVNGMDVPLNRNTVYNGKWKFRYAYEQDSGFPVVMGGPIPHGAETQKKHGLVAKPKVSFSLQTADAVLKKVYKKSLLDPAPLPWDWDADETGHDNF